MCFIFLAQIKLVILPIYPQAYIFYIISHRWLPSPTAKPLSLSLAYLLDKRSSLLSQITSTGNMSSLACPQQGQSDGNLTVLQGTARFGCHSYFPS